MEEWLWNFVTESNLIEGITRAPTSQEIEAHELVLQEPFVSVSDFERFVATVQPDATLRRWRGQNVRVGNHVPIPGGPMVVDTLEGLLDRVCSFSPFDIYCRYETLHPFTDGNGRSGRALWLWSMRWRSDRAQPSFLREFHYQALNSHDERQNAK